MLERLISRKFRRRRALKKLGPGPMRDFLATPPPSPATSCREAGIVALDLETTGLAPARDVIVSIGLVHIEGMSIRLNTAWHQIVQVGRDIPEESAVIHQITDDQAAAGQPLDEVLPRLLERLKGRVMLAHYAAVEQQFIDAACQRIYGAPFIVPTIDTQMLARRRLERAHAVYKPSDLRLFNLRTKYHLPRYKAHNALSDALATAELFLAMVAERNRDGKCSLGDFITN
jgi:DNA polymerase-3 subunit epsilon